MIMSLLAREIVLIFVKPFVQLYNFLGQIVDIMSTLEVVILSLFLGGIVVTLALFIIMVYLLLSGKIKAVLFGIETTDDKEVG